MVHIESYKEVEGRVAWRIRAGKNIIADGFDSSADAEAWSNYRKMTFGSDLLFIDGDCIHLFMGMNKVYSVIENTEENIRLIGSREWFNESASDGLIEKIKKIKG